ncbi:sensor histidine kinase [Tenacibaculum jejuense]|uniref:histidine kinase n=1 Tax=Tenacibaculum jejuense TaxID=584609 RepID=A0A238U6R4_9FLAO|nr:GAF domain-containing sensor histidine kinase [Tenacibaculum jejuense]SNR14873.1 Two-component system sensor histidine kinase [Tenacibaculum jejuense]
MKIATPPTNEKERVEALKSYNILDTLPEEDYDNITKIAAEICKAPIALVSLVDPERQWFKSTYGLDAKETPRDYAFCAHSILQPDELFIVPDATKDHRFSDNPLTIDDPHVVFYAGAPLTTKDGHALGTLCVIDNEPRTSLSEGQKESLRALSQQVMSLLELRKKNLKLQQANQEITRLNNELNQFTHRLTHDLKTPVRGINSLALFLKEDLNNISGKSKIVEFIELISSRATYMESMINQLLQYSKVTNADISFESFNFKELLRDIVKNCDLENKVTISFKELDFNIYHSKICFIQIFQNLLTNSDKFNDKEECKVFTSCELKEESYQFIYEDNGPGIPIKFYDKVFMMFETLGETNFQNTGIGLATIKSIITRLNGSIRLAKRSNDKEGVRFEFEIPKPNLFE